MTVARVQLEPARRSGSRKTGPSRVKLQLMDAISRHIVSDCGLAETVEQIVETTQTTVRATAASLLLPDESGFKLHFGVVKGNKSRELKEVTLDLQSGIVGWVARHMEPVIVNDVSMDARFTGEVDRSIGFETRSVMCMPLTMHGEFVGVLEVLNKVDGTGFTAQDLETLEAIAATAALAIKGNQLQQQLQDGYKATLRSLAAAIDAKDPYTRGHSARVMQYALMTGVSLGLDAAELESLEQGAVLHDVGKIGVDEYILRKPGRLTSKERSKSEQHPLIGAAIVADVPFLKEARKIILHHHERWDGAGYPYRLKGEESPLGARIVAIADAFDTMTTDRPYRQPLTYDEAVQETLRCSGSQFCPRSVEVFLDGMQKHSDIVDGAAEQLLGLEH